MNNKLSIRQKLFYAFGDIFGGGGFTIIGFLFAFYVTNVVRLKIVYLAPITFIASLWDAVSDPLMGHITDQTKSKMGRRRPYFLFGSIFVFLSFVFIWLPVDLNTQTAKFFYVLLSYLLYCTVFTVVMVPYFAYGAELTNNYVERTKLGTIRLVTSSISSLMVAVLPLTIVGLFDDIRIGYLAMSITFGLVFALGILSVFFVGKEQKIEQERIKHKLNFFKSFKEALSIKAFRQQIIVYLCGTMGIDIIVSMMLYYVVYFVGVSESYGQVFLGLAMITQIIFIPIWTKYIIKTSKSRAYFAGAIIASIFLTIMLFMPQGASMYYYLITIFFACTGISAVMFIPHVMFPDCTDVAELAYGKRMEGRLSGVMTFCRKCGRAVSTSSITLVLGILGYIESDSGIYMEQSSTVIIGIKVIISVLPILLFTTAAMIVRGYKLDGQTHDKLIKHLNFINKKPDGYEMSDYELDETWKKLIGKQKSIY